MRFVQFLLALALVVLTPAMAFGYGSRIVPDSAPHGMSAGSEKTFGNCSANLAHELSVAADRTIVNDSGADGRYCFLSNAVSITVGYHY